MSNSFYTLIPQKVRGNFYRKWLETESSDYIDVANITGQGKLLFLSCCLMDVSDTVQVRLLIDGVNFGTFSLTGTLERQHLMPFYNVSDNFLELFSVVDPLTFLPIFNFEFGSSLLVQTLRFIGGAAPVKCGVIYQLDEF